MDWTRGTVGGSIRVGRAGLAALIAIASASCGDEATVDAPVASALEAHERPLLDRAFARARVTRAGVTIVETEDGIATLAGTRLRALPIPGELVGAADVTGGRLIASSAGTYVVDDEGIATAELIDTAALGALVDVADTAGALWLVSERGVARVRDSQVRATRPSSPWSGAPSAAAASPDGRALWIVVGGELFRVDADADALALARLDAADVVGVGVGEDGALVVATSAGVEVHRDGVASPGPDVGAIRAVRGHPSGVVWIRGDDGLLRWDGAAWTPVDGISVDARLLAATPQGGALLTGPGATRVAHAGPAVGVFGGLGPVLSQPVRLEPWVTRPQQIDRVELAVDGSVLTPDPDGAYRLDPAGIGFLEATLAITAYLANGEVYARATRTFRSEPSDPPTWSQDIAPLVEEKCALCHGEGATARPLHARSSWVEQIDTIITNVSTGRMPLPPVELLDPAEVARVQTWRDAGFPE